MTSTNVQQRPSRVQPYERDHTARFIYAFLATLMFLAVLAALIGYFA